MSEDKDHVEVVLDDPKEDKKNDDIVVEVEKDEPEAVKTKEKTVKAEKSAEISTDEGINELKKSLEREKLARLEAEKRARQAYEHAQRATEGKTESDYQLVVNAIETVKERNDTLKSAYADAMGAGDYAKAAEIQEALATNATQLSELKRGKKAMKDQMKSAEEAATQQPQFKGDLVDQIASNVSPKSASWLRDNRDNLRDERTIRRMYRAHEDAVDDGIVLDSDEYFSFIENRLGFHKNDDADPVSDAAAPSPRRQVPPPAAPVSRGNQRPNVIRLSREQADTAKMMGMTEAEYAKNMIALRNEGKMGRQ